MKISKRFARFSMLALATASIGLGAAVAQAADKVVLGDSSPSAYSFEPPAIGVKYGIFQKYGIDIEQASFAGSAKLHQAMTAGSVDIGLGSGTDIAFIAKGAPEMAVAAMAGPPLLFGFSAADPNIKTAADLKGKKIGVSTPASSSEWLALQLVKKEGWNKSDITLVYVGSDTPAQTAALLTHQIDAVVSATALGLSLEEKGKGHLLFPASEVVTVPYLTHVIFASNDEIKNHPDVIRRFLQGWFETINFMKSHRDETIAMTRQRTNYDEAIENKEYDIVTPMFLTNGHFDPAVLKSISASMVELKLMDSAVDLSKYVTNDFVPK